MYRQHGVDICNYIMGIQHKFKDKLQISPGAKITILQKTQKTNK
jgi:hypothetical protein